MGGVAGAGGAGGAGHICAATIDDTTPTSRADRNMASAIHGNLWLRGFYLTRWRCRCRDHEVTHSHPVAMQPVVRAPCRGGGRYGVFCAVTSTVLLRAVVARGC
jgi:hypothetical protein